MAFDLYNLLVNELAGGIIFFLLLAILAIFIICMKFNLPYSIGIMFSVLLIGILVSYDPDWMALWALIVVIVFALAGREFKKLYEA